MKKNVLVIGDACVDTFIYGKCTRLNPEAPTPIFKKNGNEISNTGMSGNVISNIKSISNDEIRVFYYINNPKNITKIRYVDESSNYILLRIDEDDKNKEVFSNFHFHELITSSTFDAVVISDYCKGFLSIGDVSFILETCYKLGIPTFLDTKKILDSWSIRATCIKINKSEYDNCVQNSEVGQLLWTNNNLVVTLGGNGCDRYVAGKYIEHHKQEPVEVRDVSGAGDTFLAGLVVEYLNSGDKDMRKACIFANKCARIAVSKRGVVAVKKEEIV